MPTLGEPGVLGAATVCVVLTGAGALLHARPHGRPHHDPAPRPRPRHQAAHRGARVLSRRLRQKVAATSTQVCYVLYISRFPQFWHRFFQVLQGKILIRVYILISKDSYHFL